MRSMPTRHSVATLVVLCCAVCLCLASCGQSLGTPASSPAVNVRAADAQNGSSLTLRAGQTLLVTLASTYWSFQGTSNPQVLVPVGGPVVSPAPSPTCPVAGSGCGTVAQEFRAVAPGTAQVTASRVSCGEALRCGDAAGHYRLTVEVTAAVP